MRYKATFVLGFGTGYVLGSKAGRARYEQIMRATRSFLGTPAVQEAKMTLAHETGSLIGTAKRVVSHRIAGKDVADDTGRQYATTSSGRIDPYPS